MHLSFCSASRVQNPVSRVKLESCSRLLKQSLPLLYECLVGPYPLYTEKYLYMTKYNSLRTTKQYYLYRWSVG